MKKTIILFFGVAVMSTLFYCSRNDMFTNEDASPENSVNKFDKSGERHNLILSKVTSVMKNRKLTSKGELDELVNESIRLSNEEFIENYAQYYDNPTILDVPDIRAVMADSLNNYHNVIAATANMSSSYKSKGEELVQIFMDAASSSRPTSYEDFKAQVVSFENSVIDSDNLSQNEKDMLLNISSIGRYSAYYWQDELGNDTQTTDRKWWKWLVVAVCDVAGGFGGASGGVGGASSGAASLVDWVSPENP